MCLHKEENQSNLWINFFSPDLSQRFKKNLTPWNFSPARNCFLRIPARCMYLSLGAQLQAIGVWYWTVRRSVHLSPAYLNERVLCLLHARCIASHQTDAYIVSFFETRGRSVLPRLSPFGLSNYNYQGWILQPAEDWKILQRAMTKSLNQV